MMEPSKASGEFSGNNNNESGWTSYIGSPFHYNTHSYNDYAYDDDDDKQSVDTEEYRNMNIHGNNAAAAAAADDDDDDDSMASDASSGPSHLQLLGINSEGSIHGSDQINIKHHEEDNNNHHRAREKTVKRRYGRKVVKEEEEEEEEEELVVEADSVGSHV